MKKIIGISTRSHPQEFRGKIPNVLISYDRQTHNSPGDARRNPGDRCVSELMPGPGDRRFADGAPVESPPARVQPRRNPIFEASCSPTCCGSQGATSFGDSEVVQNLNHVLTGCLCGTDEPEVSIQGPLESLNNQDIFAVGEPSQFAVELGTDLDVDLLDPAGPAP